MRQPLSLVLTAYLCAALATPGFAQEGSPSLPLPQAATPAEAAPPVAVAPDTALLLPLLEALAAPPTRRAGLLKPILASGDPRAVAALRYAGLHDRNPAVGEAAIEALREVALPEAVSALVDIAVGTEVGQPKPGALGALSRHAHPSGADALYRIAANGELDMELRRSAVEVLGRDHPQLLTARGMPSLGGSAVTATLGGAYFGGWALSSVGDFAGHRGAGTIGWFTGAVVGAGTGYIFGRHLSNARQHYYLSALSWGSWMGWQLADAVVFQPVDEFGNPRASAEETGLSRTRAALALAGELAGLALAAYGADSLNLSSSDVLTADVMGVAAALGTSGALGLMDPTDDSRAGYGTLLAGSLLGVGVGVLTAPNLRFSTGDLALATYMSAEGAYFGGFLTDVVRNSRPESSGVLLGGGLGVLTAMALTQNSELRPGQVGEILLLSSFGKALGGGAALLAGANEDTTTLVHLAGGAAGIAAAAFLTDYTEYSSGDFAIVPVATALGLWHGAWIGAIASDGLENNGQTTAGITLLGGSLLGIGGIALTQNVGWTNLQTTMGSSGAIWGAWFAGWSLALESDTTIHSAGGRMLALTDLGLAASAVLMSPLVELDPRVMAGANFGGIAGAGLASLFTAMFSTDGNAVIKANLGGSAVGLVLGGVLASVAISDDKPDATKKLASTSPSLPNWLRWPFDTVTAVPYSDPTGKVDGVMLQAISVW
jgi:hypothetical protein